MHIFFGNICAEPFKCCADTSPNQPATIDSEIDEQAVEDSMLPADQDVQGRHLVITVVICN